MKRSNKLSASQFSSTGGRRSAGQGKKEGEKQRRRGDSGLKATQVGNMGRPHGAGGRLVASRDAPAFGRPSSPMLPGANFARRQSIGAGVTRATSAFGILHQSHEAPAAVEHGKTRSGPRIFQLFQTWKQASKRRAGALGVSSCRFGGVLAIFSLAC